jgi:hypothetical protein
MKAASLAATCLTLLIASPNARADHRLCRTLDDLAFAAMSDARDARWEIHDHFDASRDYQSLLDDADELMLALRNFQDAVYREDHPQRLAQLMDAAHDAVAHLQEHADHSDFASYGGGEVRYRGGGYSYQPRTRHAGYVHVEDLHANLDRVDSSLHELDDVMDRAFGQHDQTPHTLPGNVGGPYFEGPALPPLPGNGHGNSLPPVVLPPGQSAQTVSIPLPGGRFRARID